VTLQSLNVLFCGSHDHTRVGKEGRGAPV
jgi:hypothetical protein